MDALGSTMFFELCRLCLKNPGVTKVCEDEFILRDIFNCTGIQIHANDNLPQNVCATCMDIVNSCKELRELAAQNDSNLRILFGESIETQDEHEPQEMPIPLQTSIKSSPSKLEQEKPNKIHISVRSDLFEKPTKSNKEEPKYVKKRKKHKSYHSSDVDKHKKRTKENLSYVDDKKRTEVNLSSDDNKNKNNIQEKPEDNLSDDDDENRLVIDEGSTDVKEKKLSLSLSEIKVEIGGKFCCTICAKTFDTHKKLYLHKRQHDKKIICPIDVCGKRFTNKSELDRHVRTHTGEKPFTCDTCDKRFAQNVTLKQHKETVHSCFS